MIEEENKMKTEEVNAVYSEDMVELLESLGILHKIKNGKKKCYFCRHSVKLQDIASVFPAENEVQVCCSSYDCYKQLMRKELLNG
jgi:hypothetical protein